MNPIRALLAATDFSRDARNAALRASMIATEHHATLTLLHVISEPMLDALRARVATDPTLEARLQAAAARALDELAADVVRDDRGSPAATRVVTGEVRAAIRAAAADVDLLVLGEHGSSRLRDRLLGTTAARLLRSSPTPVLVAKRAPRRGYRRVLVPVDFSRHSGAALDFALRLAPGADIVVFHAFEVPFEGKLWHAGLGQDEIHRYRVDARRQALADLDAMIASREAAGGGAERLRRGVRHGAPTRAVLEKADEMDADLIVIGRHGSSQVEELLLGSVARHVLGAAACDVAVVVDADRVTG